MSLYIYEAGANLILGFHLSHSSFTFGYRVKVAFCWARFPISSSSGVAKAMPPARMDFSDSVCISAPPNNPKWTSIPLALIIEAKDSVIFDQSSGLHNRARFSLKHSVAGRLRQAIASTATEFPMYFC